MFKRLKDRLQGKAPRGSKRSGQWPKVRAEHLALHSTCSVCGASESTEVHHIKPFHLDPKLELDPSNLITLCESKKHGVNCHLWVGHLGNFKGFNPDVTSDSASLAEKLVANQERIKS